MKLLIGHTQANFSVGLLLILHPFWERKPLIDYQKKKKTIRNKPPHSHLYPNTPDPSGHNHITFTWLIYI